METSKNANPTPAMIRAHNHRAMSTLCKVCGTVHTCNALGRNFQTPLHWLPYRVVEPDSLGVCNERRFYDQNGNLAMAPKEWHYATLDEILDQLGSTNSELISLGPDGMPRIFP